MSDDLIKRSDVLFMIDAFERDFQQSWKAQFRADVDAIPAIKDDRIEAAEVKLAKAVKVLRFEDPFISPSSRAVLAELEKEND